MQLEVEEKIGRVQREAVEQVNAAQDAGAAQFRALAEAAGE